MTAENLKEEILQDVPVNKVEVFVGTASSSKLEHNKTITIPLPSGYLREQCRYWIVNTEYTYDWDDSGTEFRTLTSQDINQNTGIISFYTASSSINVTVFYQVIAVK